MDGKASPGPGLLSPGAAASGAVPAIRDCVYDCFEPSVAVDAAGRIVVTTGNGGQMAVSEDGGRNFTPLPAMPLPPGTPANAKGADSLLETDAAGRVYYVAPPSARTREGHVVAVWSSHSDATLYARVQPVG